MPAASRSAATESVRAKAEWLGYSTMTRRFIDTGTPSAGIVRSKERRPGPLEIEPDSTEIAKC